MHTQTRGAGEMRGHFIIVDRRPKQAPGRDATTKLSLTGRLGKSKITKHRLRLLSCLTENFPGLALSTDAGFGNRLTPHCLL